MCQHESDGERRLPIKHTCCPCGCDANADAGRTRRGFLGDVGGLAALGGVALSGLSWSALQAAEPEVPAASPRRPLVVKPIFTYSTYQPRPQTSWRPWGGIQTQQDAEQEAARIKGELAKLQSKADFPVKFLPLSPVRGAAEVDQLKDAATADVILVYAADGGMNSLKAIAKLGKDVIHFVRHRSGPVYLWYEIISPRYLRQHTDKLAVEGTDFEDVVVDSQEDILWRLRSLCGLHNTVGSRILAVGGPAGWAQPREVITELVKNRWKLDIQTVSYNELGKLIQAARADKAAVDLARRRADEYLKLPGTTLETKRPFVDNAFLLEGIFRRLMAKAGCRAITINGCMSTIMPLSETTACLPLSTLNDDGYLAFCESDFVVIPSGILLGCHLGQAALPARPNLPTPRHDHPGPLHGPAEDGRQDAGAGPDHDPFRVGLRRHAEGQHAQRPAGDDDRARLRRRALDGPVGRDCRPSVPAHLPLADRRELQARPATGRRADARLPLDARIRRLRPRDGLRPEEDTHRVGLPGLRVSQISDCGSRATAGLPSSAEALRVMRM